VAHTKHLLPAPRFAHLSCDMAARGSSTYQTCQTCQTCHTCYSWLLLSHALMF